jgi:tripartite-type tricarboxylate transporter receptor subunit TctC
MAESGVTGYASDTWYGIVAPAGTPLEVVALLHAAAAKAIGLPAVRERLTRNGAEPAASTPEEFRKLIESEQKLWAKVVKDSGAKVD